MKATLLACTILLAVVSSFNTLVAADRSGADALAAAGAALVAKGNISQAKDMLYKALANDENCPDAIFELAKIFDKENAAVSAGDFYQRAMILMAQESKPETVSKRAEADRRVKALNPFAPRIGGIFEDYAQDLDRLLKKVPDSVTQDAALARVDELKMSSIITAEKMPKFYASAHAKKVADQVAASKPKPTRSFINSNGEMSMSTKPVNSVPPDVERDLKAAGWTTITGTWVKKSSGVYEVTNGKLESQKTNGGVDVWVHKITASNSSVRAAVHNDYNNSSSDSVSSSSSGSSSGYYYSSSDYNGYGTVIRAKEFRLYGPGGYSGFSTSSRYEPSHIRSENMVEGQAKTHVTSTIMDDTLELSVNEKKSFRFKDAKMPKSASPFVIEVRGTATIENPRCAGQ
jgi:tetratricopeptide (TPR) repeat protein